MEREVLAAFDALPVFHSCSKALSGFGLTQPTKTPNFGDAASHLANEPIRIKTSHQPRVAALASGLKPSYMMAMAARKSDHLKSTRKLIPAPPIRDVRSTLGVQVGQAVAGASEQAVVLENLGAQELEAIGDTRRNSEPRDLFAASAPPSWPTLHGASVLA